MQQIDDVHKNKIVSKILNDEPVSYDRQIYWVASKLKPGKIKSIKDRNFIIFCLPTPLTKKNYPDLSYIMNALKIMKNFCSSQSIFVLESTVYPGATEEIYVPILEKKSGLIFNKDFPIEPVDPSIATFFVMYLVIL